MNAFLDLAEAQTPHPVKVRRDAAERRRTETDAARDEKRELSRLYRASQREWVDAALSGPNGGHLSGVATMLRTIHIGSAPALIAFFERATWVRDLSQPERQVLLHIIGGAIARIRIRAGLPPYDDALPDQPDTAFDAIKRVVLA